MTDRPDTLFLTDAVLMPAKDRFPDPSRPPYHAFDGGVYDRARRLVPLGRHPIGQTRNIGAEEQPRDAVATLAGTWLFLGWLREHFGHFFQESMGRIWYHHHLKEPIAGVVFLPYNYRYTDPATAAAKAEQLAAMHYPRRFVELAGVTEPIAFATEATRVERLIVPAPISLALEHSPPEDFHEQHRMFSRMKAHPAVRAEETPRKIYVSRSALPAVNGKFVLEKVIEGNLSRAGYAIVHPQDLSLERQIAMYAGARKIVFAEGTTIHMAAAFSAPEAAVAIIARRFPILPRFEAQLAEAGVGKHLVVSERVGAVRSYEREGSDVRLDKNNDQKSHVLLDYAAVARRLAEHGFIRNPDWRLPDDAAIERGIAKSIKERKKSAKRHDFRWVADPFSREPRPFAERARRAAAKAAEDAA